MRGLPDIEVVSAKVHEAWMQSKAANGVTSRRSESGEELMVSYAALSEAAKELDRGTVRAVYTAIGEVAAKVPLAPHGIGWAIKELTQNGERVCRAGWNGKNMYLELQVPDAHSKMTLPYVYMRTAQDDLVPWLASQTDLLAVDWGHAT